MDQTGVLRIKTEDGETLHYHAFYEGVPEHFRLYAKRVLNETEESRTKGLQRIKDCMKRENLSCPDDLYLLSILRSNKYNFKKIEKKLKNSLKSRQLIISKVAEIKTSTLETIIDDLIFTILPYRDKFGRAVYYTRPCLNLDRYEMDEVSYCGLAAQLYTFSFPLTSINGWVHIGDCKTPSMSLFYPITKSFKHALSTLANLSSRLGRIDVINEHFLARWCLLALRPFLPDKINKRVAFHGSNMKTIHKLYHPDLLPDDIEGNTGPVTNKHYRENLLAFIANLKKENLQYM